MMRWDSVKIKNEIFCLGNALQKGGGVRKATSKRACYTITCYSIAIWKHLIGGKKKSL